MSVIELTPEVPAGDRIDKALGARCHALRVRLTKPVHAETLADRLSTVMPSRLWVEDVPGAAAEPIAERRRTAELSRPVTDLRCVLLRYTDGQADLVAVAHRGLLDSRALRRLVAVLTGTPATLTDLGAPSRLVPVLAAPAPDWGLGESRGDQAATHLLALPRDADGDEASWLAALAATVCRYAEDTAPVLATDHGAVEVSATTTLGELRRRTPVPVDRPAVVGMILGLDADPVGDEYLPCLTPPFPLTISVCRQPDGGLSLRCDHLLSHFAPAIVAQIARHLAHVHQQVLHAPEKTVADAALLDKHELARVAALGRPSTALVTTPACLHEAFGRVAAATPEAIALSDTDIRLTYRELDERSSWLAHGLRAFGVRDGDRVGICLDRSTELVVTLLGVLKAGATYVPTDPAYPTARLSYIAEDAQLGIVVTRLPEFPRRDGTRPVTPDELIEKETPSPVISAVTPDDAAYVIYTSGSTGRPKGVVVPHRNVISLIDATREEYQLGSRDVWTLFHSSAFDFSVWEIWGCLLTGGHLVVVPYFVSRAPEEFRDLLVTRRVTVLSQTPSAFSQLLDVDHTDLAVRLVVFGGEPLDARMLLRWFDRHPETTCRMVNMFGITETTVHVTAQTVSRKLALAASRSVGQALPGWHLYVMDPTGRLVPPGVAGEIHVGGAGVAARYLNQEELTGQRFLPDPFTGGRMYRSGDRGRLRPDGRLEHLGRIDSQVKVRGFRIELNEIRSVLLEDPDVRTAAILVRRDDPVDAATARIDAYVVLARGNTSDVQRRAAGILPAYMVPATVTALTALPLTTNGKLDASKLPAPSSRVRISSAATPATRPPVNDLAATMIDVWGEVLGVPVGPDDDFFELGGNSLFAVRIGAAMRARGLPSPPLRELYRQPTIRELADMLSYGT